MPSNLLLGNPIQSFNEGQAVGRQNRFNALAGQAVAAPADQRAGLLGQAAQADPIKAVALQGELAKQDDTDEDRRNKALANMARFYVSAPDAAKPQVRAQLAPSLAKFGIDATNVSPEDFDKAAQAIVEAWTPTSATPTGFREFDMKARAAGLKPGTPEYEQAARVALGTEGRASNAGYGFEQVEGADGRKYLQRRNPRTGAVEVYDPTTGDFAPVGGGAAPAGAPAANPDPTIVGPIQTQPVAPQVDTSPVDDANRWLRAGLPEQEVGVRLAAKYGQQLGGAKYPSVVIRNGVATAGSTGGAPARAPADPSLLVSRAPEDTAGAVQNAKNASDLAYLPQTERIKADSAVDQAGRTATAKGEAERQLDQPQAQASLTDAESNLDRMAQAANDLIHHPGLRGITSWNARVPDAPGSDAANARALLTSLKSQIGFGVLQAMRNASKTGGALGSVSDAEGVRLENNLAALEQSQSPEAFASNLQKIIDYTKGTKGRLRNAYDQTYGGRAPAAAAQHPTPQTQADFDALPSGALYVDPDDGKTYRKP